MAAMHVGKRLGGPLAVFVTVYACAGCDPGPVSERVGLYSSPHGEIFLVVRVCGEHDGVSTIGVGPGFDRWAEPAEWFEP